MRIDSGYFEFIDGVVRRPGDSTMPTSVSVREINRVIF